MHNNMTLMEDEWKFDTLKSERNASGEREREWNYMSWESWASHISSLTLIHGSTYSQKSGMCNAAKKKKKSAKIISFLSSSWCTTVDCYTFHARHMCTIPEAQNIKMFKTVTATNLRSTRADRNEIRVKYIDMNFMALRQLLLSTMSIFGTN